MTDNFLTDTPTLSQKIKAVDNEWVKSQIKEFGIKNMRQLSIASNVNYGSLTLAMAGERKFSSEIKKTLYWFFYAKSLEKQLNEEG